MPVLDALFPPRCPLCRVPGAVLCRNCWRRLRPPAPAPPPVGVDRCRSLLAYDDAARTLLVRLKYRNERAVVGWLATAMAGLVRETAAQEGVLAVTWAPTTGHRRRARGFDQAELLARAIARELHLPCPRLLVRSAGAPQTGRRRDERWEGPVFVSYRHRAPPASVLLVDDVMTTGATVAAAARTLRHRGASRVIVVTAATTPLKVPAVRVDP